MVDKLAMGMFPHISKLLAMGVKPGSGSLLKFLKKPVQQATQVGKRPVPLGLAGTALMQRRVPRLMPDVRDVLRQRAQTAGTLWKSGSEDRVLPEHHFRNLLAMTGPVGGTLGGGLQPILQLLEERAEPTPRTMKEFKNVFKIKIPWKKVRRGMGKGSVHGLLSGAVAGMLLDKYLGKKLEGATMKKSAGALQKYAQGMQQPAAPPTPPQQQSSFDPAQSQMLEQYYEAPIQERAYSPQEEQASQLMQQQYMQAQEQPQPQEPQEPPQLPEPQEMQPEGPQPQLTADMLEQQLQTEQKGGMSRYDSGTRVNKIRLARMFEQQGMDPVTAMSQSEHTLQQLFEYYGGMQGVTGAVQQMTGENWQQQQQIQAQQQQAQTQQTTAQQQDQYRQQAAPPAPTSPQK